MEDRIQLDNLFRISEPLKRAYALKEQFEHVKSSHNRQEAAERLSRWIMDAQNSRLPEFGTKKYVGVAAEMQLPF